MHPILFQIGDFSVRGYGLMVAVGFMAGIWVVSKEAARVGEDREKIVDMAFYIILAAIIGARLLYILVEWRYFVSNPIDVFKFWKGGLVFYGGLIGAVAAGALYVKKHNLRFWKTADIFALAIPLGHAFGRIGCFAAGCCYGKATDLPWAVRFTDPESMAPLHIDIHPTQIYSSLNALAIFAVLMFFRKRKRFEGQLALIYVIVYSITRSLIEFLRADDRGALLAGYISTSQVISLFLVIAAAFAMFYLRGAKKASTT